MDAQTAPGIGTFDNSYARLPARFFQKLHPTQVAAPRLIKVNHALAEALGLDLTGLDDTTLAAIFAGNLIPTGAEPIAQAYAGHQFGGFSPQLGDGRAILLGEVVDPDGARWDIQLKGSGPTAFSRRGDGRAALGPVLREYLISEAMHALGIPATRALAAVTTGERVARESLLPGAVFTRVAASHVRVGTFQYFAARGDAEALQILADYVIQRHYPQAAAAESPYLALLAAVVARQAGLIAQWMGVGFIHGVMNTDNMAISGQSIDFGPCAFMDAFDPATVFSSIDSHGRYAYANQPAIAQWNLARFAETLLPILGLEEAAAVAAATEVLNGFAPSYRAATLAVMRAKLGLAGEEDGDQALAQGLLDAMHAARADFTLAFRALCDAAGGEDGEWRALFAEAPADVWLEAWRARRERAGASAAAMRLVNPLFIPRNHRVEQAIEAAVQRGDFAPFERLLAVLLNPFDDRPENAEFRLPPAPEERVLATFCGT
jgi:uncharacterized protein YdiU (UPF0061 family)